MLMPLVLAIARPLKPPMLRGYVSRFCRNHKVLAEDRPALSFGEQHDDCHECPVEGIDDDDFFIDDLSGGGAPYEHGHAVQPEKPRLR